MSKKRSHGEGTIRQREGGRWEGTLMIGYQSDGRRKYKTFYGRTQTEVKKLMREYQVARENGELIGRDFAFSEWADLWFEHHRENIKPTIGRCRFPRVYSTVRDCCEQSIPNIAGKEEKPICPAIHLTFERNLRRRLLLLKVFGP